MQRHFPPMPFKFDDARRSLILDARYEAGLRRRVTRCFGWLNRSKRLIGPKRRARTDAGQHGGSPSPSRCSTA